MESRPASTSPNPAPTPDPSPSPELPSPPKTTGPSSDTTPPRSTDGHASPKELKAKSLDELRRLAQAAGVRGYSRMKKDQLIRALSRNVPKVERTKPRPVTPPPSDRVAVSVDPEDVKHMLAGAGDMLHMLGCRTLELDRNDPRWADLFRLTPDEQNDIAPPLARILQKRAAAARFLEASDEILVTMHAGRWALRNVIEARFAIEVANAEAEAVVPDEPEIKRQPQPTPEETGGQPQQAPSSV